MDNIDSSNINFIQTRINIIDKLFEKLGQIEKKIHISWKSQDILNLNFNIIKYGIKQLKNLNTDYKFEISNDNDIEQYIKNKISLQDYNLIKNRHIVEKTDLWRLLKMYYEGGIYMDIDRLCNIPMKNIISSNCKCILPTYFDRDFSQDIMISCSKNIIYKTAIDLNLQRRREGETSIIALGPIVYFLAVCKILLNDTIELNPCIEKWKILRNIINGSKYLITYREHPPYDTILYQGIKIDWDKGAFYDYYNIKHWTHN